MVERLAGGDGDGGANFHLSTSDLLELWLVLKLWLGDRTAGKRARPAPACRQRIVGCYFKAPDALATWVAMASISAGDRQS